MRRRLKVYGGNWIGLWRAIIACSSMAEFTRATRISREFGCETGNADEISRAMSEPGIVFTRPLDHRMPQVWTPRPAAPADLP